MKTSSIKTTAAGVAALIGTACTALANDPHFAKWAAVLTLIATSIGVIFARDNGTSDQEAGVRPPVQGIDPPKQP